MMLPPYSASDGGQDLLLRRRAVAARLQYLRTHARPRLTRQAAAASIGLGASTGRRSISQWESGEVVPSSSWRLPMLRYLWCDLGLAGQPAEFTQLWEEIAIAWGWDPLTSVDWQELHALAAGGSQPAEPPPSEPPASEPPPSEPAMQPLNTPPSAGEDAEAVPMLPTAARAAALPPPLPAEPRRRLPIRHLLPAAALAALLALLILAAAALAPDFIAANPLFGQRPPTPAAPANLSFEAPDLAPWTVAGSAPCAQPLQDPARARTGSRYLHVATAAAPCTSLRYDLINPPAGGTTARFAIWARAAGPATESVELALWPAQRTDGEPRAGSQQSARFTVDHEQWRCLEVALPVSDPTVDLVRAEVYFDPAAPVQIDLDDASLHFDGRSACLEQSPQFINRSFETASQQLGWLFLPEDHRCRWQVVNDRRSSHAGSRYLRVERAADECTSLRQELSSAPAPGVTYRARIWVRSAGAEPVRVTWALWASGDETTAARSGMVATDQWRCVETSLALPPGGYDLLRAELYFETAAAAYAIDDAYFAIGDRPLCPPQELLLNGGFEKTPIAPWQELQRCLVAPADGAPHSGSGFVRVDKTADCASIFQDVYAPIEPGAAATFSVWARAAAVTPARGRLALRAMGSTTELAELPFTLTNTDWTCLELSLTAQAEGNDHWRPEVYFSSEGTQFDVDDAHLAPGLVGGCPQTNYALHRLEWLPGAVGYPGSAISGLVEVENTGTAPTGWPHDLRYWLAATRSGSPLFDEATGAVTVPPLAGGTGSGPLYFDLVLPPALEPGKTYYLVMDTGSTSAAAAAVERRRALPLPLEPCAADALFCDIPQNFWARAEAESWYGSGITSGCRSETQPYRDLPFCPQQALSADTMAIFLVRHLVDPAFRPAAPYAGIYADVPESHRRSMWIEALYEQIGFVERSNCPQVPGELRFCPQAPLLRQDLLRFVAAAARIAAPPASSEDAHYVDLDDQPELAALAAALWQAGVLPDDDPACPDLGLGPRFCPDAPALRIDAAVWMVRAFGG